MAKKKNQNNNENQNQNQNQNQNEKENENENENENGDEGCDGGKKQKAAGAATGVTVVVLKMDLHCEGCAGKVVKAVRALDGVESARIGDSELSKITVIGNLDPAKLRQKVEEKTKKKVELISPVAKKTKDGDKTTQSAGTGDNKKQQKQPQQPPPDKPEKTAAKKDDKKPKEIPVTTAVLKVPLHCQGCIRRIYKLVTKTKGYMEMSIDKNKDLMTVKGAIDMKLLVEALQHKLKRVVEIVPQKKDGGGGGGDDGGGKKGKGGGGGGGGGGEKKGKDDDGEGTGGGEKKGKGGGGGGEGNDGGGKMEVLKMENNGAPYPQYAYGSGYVDYVHAPQLFSDENPHACSLM